MLCHGRGRDGESRCIAELSSLALSSQSLGATVRVRRAGNLKLLIICFSGYAEPKAKQFAFYRFAMLAHPFNFHHSMTPILHYSHEIASGCPPRNDIWTMHNLK